MPRCSCLEICHNETRVAPSKRKKENKVVVAFINEYLNSTNDTQWGKVFARTNLVVSIETLDADYPA
jgi:hypothetical protein